MLNIDQIKEKIAGLEQSPMVALARAEAQIRTARLRYLRELQDLERKGRKLAEAGYDFAHPFTLYED